MDALQDEELFPPSCSNLFDRRLKSRTSRKRRAEIVTHSHFMSCFEGASFGASTERTSTGSPSMGQFYKKVVSTVVTMSTVLSSVGVGAFAVPSVASADALMNGDLIKASGAAVYYFSNNKRYVFPNEKTYMSWFPDFSAVKTISDSSLAAVMIGGNVTIRQGTNLVKITTDPKVYAVTGNGVLRWVETEAVALALYGSNWARRVVDVSDAFFVNYSIGSSVATAVHPDGSLVSYAGSADRYVVWGGMRRRVTDAGWLANGFQAAHVISTSITYPAGADVVAREGVLADAVATTGTTPPLTGSLSVSLASDTPAAMVLPKNANNVSFTKFNLMAGSAATTVTSLKFRRVGVGNTTDFSNVYLYKADGTRLTSGRTISSSDNTVSFSGINLMVGAGMTQSYFVSADLSNPGTTGGQHAFELSDAGSVMVSGSGTISGNFPIRGNAMTVGTASVARVDMIDGSEPANPRVGTQDAEIANFRLVANGSNDVEVRRVTLYQAGTITNSDLSDLRLYQGSTLLASAASVMPDGKILLVFTAPFLIPNGQSRTFNLRSAVSGRSGRTIRIYAEYSSDVYAIDKVHNVGTQVCIETSTSACTASSGNYDGSGATTNAASFSTNEGGQFTITYNGPATANVARGQNDVVFYKFAITSGSNDVEIRKFNFAASTTSSGIYNGTTEFLRDIKIKDADTGETVVSPVSCATDCSTVGYKAFNSGAISVLVRAGVTRNFVITADTSTSIADASTYKFSLGGASSDAIFGSTDLRIVSSGEFLTTGIAPNTTVTGNTMTVRTPTLAVTLAGSPSSAVFVKNQLDIPSAAFTFTAGSQNAVRVTSVKLTGQGDGEAANSGFAVGELDDVVNSCGLYDGTLQVGTRLPPGTDGTMTFSGLNLNIARGGSKTIEVRCNADSGVSKSGGDRFWIGVGAVGDISSQDEDGNSITLASVTSAINSASIFQTVKASGSITVAVNNQRQSTILIADKEMWQVLSRYRADAQFEDIEIDYMGVTSTGPSANFRDVAVVQSSDANCSTYSVRGTKTLNSGVEQLDEIDMSASKIVVPKGSATYICLMARLATLVPSSTNASTTSSPRSGNVVALGIPAGPLTIGGVASSIFTSALFPGELSMRATGAASGERVYQTLGATATSTFVGNSFVVRKSKPVVTQATSGLSNTLSAGEHTLYRAQIGSEGNQASIKQLAFKVRAATTSLMTLSNFRLYKNDSLINLADVTIINGDDDADLELATASSTQSSSLFTLAVLVRFVNEETVSGSGATYALKATVGGLSSTTGDSITTSLISRSFSGAVSTTSITGYVSTSATTLTGDSVRLGTLAISTSTNPGPVGAQGDFGYGIIWSDVSEQPHYSNIFSTTPNSRDWTNEYLVDTISGSRVLSK